MRRRLHLYLAAVLMAAMVGTVFGSSEEAEVANDSGTGEFGANDLGKLAQHWLGGFRQDHAGDAVSLRPTRSFTSTAAFNETQNDVIYLGYRLPPQAVDDFARRYGYKPTPIRVALETVAILVHRLNPIRGMTLAQVAAVFSRGSRCRGAQHAATWGALGLAGEWQARPLQVFAIGPADDVHAYFREQVMCGGGLGEFVRVQPDSDAVARAVSESLNAIGFGRSVPTVPSVKTLSLAVEANMPFVAPSERHAVDGAYPLTRFLHVYVNKHPDRPLTGPQADFVRFVLSPGGQEILGRNGFIPISRDVARREQALITAD
jgi:phosphate transport system substrate-binding protein